MVDFDKVTKAYSGKPDCCMCGCSGKYTVPTHVTASVYDEVSDRSVKYVVNKINELLGQNNEENEVDSTVQYVCVDTPTRRYTVYFD